MDIQTSAQIVIAIFLAYIAWQTYKINGASLRLQRDNLRLALFDRRLKVFEACQEAIAFVVRHGDFTREELYKFTAAASEAEFLFGAEIKTYINEFKKNGLRLIQVEEFLRNQIGTEEKRIAYADESTELGTWFSDEFENSRRLFRKYLRFSIERHSQESWLQLFIARCRQYFLEANLPK